MIIIDRASIAIVVQEFRNCHESCAALLLPPASESVFSFYRFLVFILFYFFFSFLLSSSFRARRSFGPIAVSLLYGGRRQRSRTRTTADATCYRLFINRARLLFAHDRRCRSARVGRSRSTAYTSKTSSARCERVQPAIGRPTNQTTICKRNY